MSTEVRSAPLGARLVCVGILLAAVCASALPSLADGEVVLGRAILPSVDNPQGEFVWSRLEDGTQRARTLLFTTSPRRALQKLRRKELSRWTGAVPADAARYVEFLERLRTQEWSGERAALLIEVTWSPEGSSPATCRFSAPVVHTGIAELEAPSFTQFSFDLGDVIEEFEIEDGYASDSLRVQVDEAFGEGTWRR